MPNQYERELQVIDSVADAPPLQKFIAYAKISGPGWLQGAITLGGGSLAGALFLGVISGYNLLWVQPLAMICGIIMLSAISFVTLSTEARPFHAINSHINPLLGWSWLIATIMANIVWTMPQFALATAAVQQNLLGGAEFHPVFMTIPLLITGLFVNYLYEAGGKGAKIFDIIIKTMVAIIVLSFFAVVGALLFSGKLPIGEVLKGYLPNFSLLSKPAPAYEALIAQSNLADFWRSKIAADQRDVIIAAFGTAVGINMTFLLPYSLLKKRWGKKHRGLSITDLSIGLFIPFFLATSCVVIASANSFHAKQQEQFTYSWMERTPPPAASGASLSSVVDVPRTSTAEELALTANALASGTREPRSEMTFDGLKESLGGNFSFLEQEAEFTAADFQLAQMLVKRDADSLAETLEPFAGEFVSQKIFGIGVLGMAISTIIILMLMNGLAFQEAFSRSGRENGNLPRTTQANINDNKSLFFLGCLISGLAGCCYPFLWTGDSKAALAVPTSVIGGSLIPIAYFTFLLMMNSKKILGDARPEGKARIIWNTLMIFATTVATIGSVWVLLGKSEAPGVLGFIAKGGLVFLVVLFIVGSLSFAKHEKSH
ncbi:MAG: divalent metal cation transporter [Verrucomicrobiota bacterium JB023]|nr:divalent metal cation transporter [Verrucomicrobiota bacterium JB023]